MKITWFCIPAHGHTYPTLGLVKALKGFRTASRNPEELMRPLPLYCKLAQKQINKSVFLTIFPG